MSVGHIRLSILAASPHNATRSKKFLKACVVIFATKVCLCCEYHDKSAYTCCGFATQQWFLP